jgi:hypothetical protein
MADGSCKGYSSYITLQGLFIFDDEFGGTGRSLEMRSAIYKRCQRNMVSAIYKGPINYI